jgi:hypothetical protein
MKVIVHHYDKEVSKNKKTVIDNFLKFLYREYPVKNNVEIHFMPYRSEEMTTGSRSQDNVIKVLTKNRITRDILRTIAHEWIHEYQRTILNRDRGPDIGGKNEDEANALAGSLIKKFEKKFPNFEEMMYE